MLPASLIIRRERRFDQPAGFSDCSAFAHAFGAAHRHYSDMTRQNILRLVGKLRFTLWFFSIAAFPYFLFGFTAAFDSVVIFMAAMFSLFWIPLFLIIFLLLWWAEGLRPAMEPISVWERLALGTAAPILLGLSLVSAVSILRTGGHFGDLARLAINHQSYDSIVALARRSGAAKDRAASSDGITYSVDPGPPVRVAFDPDGFLGDWRAIVFDPTGDVMHADSPDPSTGRCGAPARITKLFGGDLVSCRPLWGKYYSCGFT